jgi:hypothetical protein
MDSKTLWIVAGAAAVLLWLHMRNLASTASLAAAGVTTTPPVSPEPLPNPAGSCGHLHPHSAGLPAADRHAGRPIAYPAHDRDTDPADPPGGAVAGVAVERPSGDRFLTMPKTSTLLLIAGAGLVLLLFLRSRGVAVAGAPAVATASAASNVAGAQQSLAAVVVGAAAHPTGASSSAAHTATGALRVPGGMVGLIVAAPVLLPTKGALYVGGKAVGVVSKGISAISSLF